MVKYLAMAAAIIGSLMVADLAQARGRHGCASCGGGGYVAGGCPGGMCSVPMAAPGKMAAMDNAPPALVTAPTPASVATVAPAQPASRYYASNTARRGLFGWRR